MQQASKSPYEKCLLRILQFISPINLIFYCGVSLALSAKNNLQLSNVKFRYFSRRNVQGRVYVKIYFIPQLHTSIIGALLLSIIIVVILQAF